MRQLTLLAAVFAAAVSTAVCAENRLVAAVIIAEAGGEGDTGMSAVAEVIQTRSIKSGASATAVVSAPKQFSCLNSGTNGFIDAKSKHPKWGLALKLSSLVESRSLQTSYSKGATHFLVTGTKAKWAAKSKRVAVVGKTSFYKL